MTREEPVEAGSIDLMSWEDDSTDGTTPVKDKDHNTEFRKRADSMEGETFPKAGNLVEIEASISVTPKTKVESTRDTTGAILDLDEVGNRSVDHVVRKSGGLGLATPGNSIKLVPLAFFPSELNSVCTQGQGVYSFENYTMKLLKLSLGKSVNWYFHYPCF